MLYKAANFWIMIIKSYYAKQMLKIIWNKTILNNNKKEDKAKSSNKNKIKRLK